MSKLMRTAAGKALYDEFRVDIFRPAHVKKNDIAN